MWSPRSGSRRTTVCLECPINSVSAPVMCLALMCRSISTATGWIRAYAASSAVVDDLHVVMFSSLPLGGVLALGSWFRLATFPGPVASLWRTATRTDWLFQRHLLTHLSSTSCTYAWLQHQRQSWDVASSVVMLDSFFVVSF